MHGKGARRANVSLPCSSQGDHMHAQDGHHAHEAANSIQHNRIPRTVRSATVPRSRHTMHRVGLERSSDVAVALAPHFLHVLQLSYAYLPLALLFVPQYNHRLQMPRTLYAARATLILFPPLLSLKPSLFAAAVPLPQTKLHYPNFAHQMGVGCGNIPDICHQLDVSKRNLYSAYRCRHCASTSHKETIRPSDAEHVPQVRLAGCLPPQSTHVAIAWKVCRCRFPRR